MLSKDEYQDLRYKCGVAFRKAKRDGLIEPIQPWTKCVDCGEPAVAYDHRNYYKPLEVEPVCKSCNAKRGPAYPYCDDWHQHRAGNESHMPDDLAFDVRLSIEFDLKAYEDFEDYYVLFGRDEEYDRWQKYVNEDYYRNTDGYREFAREQAAKREKLNREKHGHDYYKFRKVRNLLAT